MELKGKSVLITGAAKRLGRETSIHLARAGARITVHYNESNEEAESLRKEISCQIVQADFTKISMEELCRRLEIAAKEVDVLINNASRFTHSPWREISEQLWDRELAVNLKVPFFLTKYFGDRMKQRGSGKILNIADIAAEHPYLMFFPYSVAKAGIVTMTRGFARALAPEVQVNAIAPGTVVPPENMNAAQVEKIIQKIPAHRAATVKEFLRTVDFLLADVDYITGQTIVLDGGRSLNW
ncbi:MAG TPA: SDR family NAD(P)-dependent oxidoreductase [Acidobacteriota bacterium]|nr:SDR family NAD(P)-dependent oxidoreductase [Acidobacteriota bacterium]